MPLQRSPEAEAKRRRARNSKKKKRKDRSLQYQKRLKERDTERDKERGRKRHRSETSRSSSQQYKRKGQKRSRKERERSPARQEAKRSRKEEDRSPARIESRREHDATRSENRAVERLDYNTRVITYEESIKEGPIHSCQCCDCLFFERQIRHCDRKTLEKDVGVEFLNSVCVKPMSKSTVIFCLTCLGHIMKNEIPRLAICKGLAFPEIPDELRVLSVTEERLVAPILPFVQIRELKVGKQFQVKGNVVNVPINVETTVSALPRTFDNSQTVQLKLKRMLKHKSDYCYDVIRPGVVLKAAEYLIQQPLYKDIVLNTNWNKAEVLPFICDPNDNVSESDSDSDFQEEKWDETIGTEPANANPDETFLAHGLVLAPGEGVAPVSVFSDEFLEEKAFPKIYGGRPRNVDKALHYSEIVKSEIKRTDRRCCVPPKLFFNFRVKEQTAHRGAVSTHLRMTTGLKSINAGQALNKEFMADLERKDNAYSVLKDDRSSPAYWQARKRDLMAMIRQLGIPTVFLTLSAAETHWNELLVILTKVLFNKVITEEEASHLSWMEKCELIQKDPVTCARYFDHRIKELFKLLKAVNGPFGAHEILEFYIRIEFQHRGSPHIHCLIWLKRAPVFDISFPESWVNCERFIDSLITCSVREREIEALVSLQYHKHSKSCRRLRRDAEICRFGIPYFPMDSTRVLDNLSIENMTDDERKDLDDKLTRIKSELILIDDKLKSNKRIMSFEKFLSAIGLSNDEYIYVIRTTIKRPTVFLRREPSAIRTNGYNKEILLRHRANMDIQFILDPFACVNYILNYINKSDRGMSTLLRQVVDECNAGNKTHGQRLSRICSQFINCSEVSAQEAVYILLSLPLSESSKATVYINTGRPEDRIKILKSKRELKELDDNSTDIVSVGLLEHYIQRPLELETTSLAEFAANYNIKKKLGIRTANNGDNNDNEDRNAKYFRLKDRSAYLIKRKKSKIIRFRKYRKEVEPINYYREKCMLYIPWRNEEKELLDCDIEAKYTANYEQIIVIEKCFVHHLQSDLDLIQAEIEQNLRDEWKLIDEEETADKYAIHDLIRNEDAFEKELLKSESNNPSAGSFLCPQELNDNSYHDLISSLNARQREFLYGLMGHVKHNKDPFHYFLTGGAGTGKSVLIRAVFQSLIRWYNTNEKIGGPEDIKVLLTGPTGKSAFNIRGTTIHAALGLTTNENKQEIKFLSADKKSTLRSKLWHLKVLIIDEVSMVGFQKFKEIDSVLRQIFDKKEPFGGVSVLVVGDLNQLPPVKDNAIYKNPLRGYDVLSNQFLWHMFKVYRLTEIMRQKEDYEFAKALNNLANACLTDSDKQLFTGCIVKSGDNGVIHLFTTNQSVDEYNSRIVSHNKSTGYISEAVDTVSKSHSSTVRKQALYTVSTYATAKTQGLARRILLKVGVRYMVSTNINIIDGLANGTTGWLRQIELNSASSEAQRLWFDFGETDIGRTARSKYRQTLYGETQLTPIDKIVRDINVKPTNRYIAVHRRQFPVVIAEAITIHKSQGETYDKLVVDLRGRFTSQMMYTAFSRSRTARGLQLVGADTINFPKPRDETSELSQEFIRLDGDARLEFSNTITLTDEQMYLYYQNVPYFAGKSSHLLNDNNVNKCVFIAIVECRANGHAINGYRLAQSCESGLRGCDRPFGINFYIRNDYLTYSESEGGYFESSNSHMEFVLVSLNAINSNVLVVYISPSFPKREALKHLKYLINKYKNNGERLIIVGDFNMDVNKKGLDLIETIESLGLYFPLTIGSPSHNSGSQLDYCFTNNRKDTAFYYESLLSDHKAIITSISE